MARSHLSQRLSQAYTLAAQAQPDLPQTRPDRPPAQAQTQPAEPVPPAQKASVLVVGAGLAGLTVAYRLRQAGLAVDVIEGRDRVGGRMLSQPNLLETGLTAEIGGEVFDSDHSCCLALIAELGLERVDIYQYLDPATQPTYYFNGQSVDLAELAAELTPLIPRLQPDLKRVHRFLKTGRATAAVQALDQLSVTEYVASLGASLLLQAVVQAAYTTRYGTDAAVQSSLNLLSFIAPQPGQFELFGASDERYFVAGGNDQIPARLAAAVADSIQLGSCLEALRQQPDGRYQVSWRSGCASCDRSYEQVVLALPFTQLRQVALAVELPPRQRLAIDSLSYNSATKVITAYRQKRWLTQYRNNGLVFSDLPMQHAWESSGSLRTAQTGLVTHYLGGETGQQASGQPLATLAASLVADLDQIFPGVAGDRCAGAVRSQWLSDDFSLGAYSCYQVGQWTRFYGSEGQRTGNLFFAGEHCSRQHQGYMEGACQSGEAVAAALLAELQRPV